MFSISLQFDRIGVIVDLANDGRDRNLISQDRSSQPSFAGDERKAFALDPDNDRLDNAVFLDRLCKLAQLFLVESFSIVFLDINPIYGNVL